MENNKSSSPIDIPITEFEFLFNWKNILDMRKYEIKGLEERINSLPNIDKIIEADMKYKQNLNWVFLKGFGIFFISNLIGWSIKTRPIFMIAKIFTPVILTTGFCYYDFKNMEQTIDEKYKEHLIILEQDKIIRDIILKENVNYGLNVSQILKN